MMENEDVLCSSFFFFKYLFSFVKFNDNASDEAHDHLYDKGEFL